MASSWISKNTRAAIYRRDRGTCAYCGCELHIGAHNSDPRAASLDHITARINGGDLRDPRNLVACCVSCNSSKGDSVKLDKWAKARGLDAKAIKKEISLRIKRVVK
jgi:5-methylcytosine-specific restriction endonuclease McrA